MEEHSKRSFLVTIERCIESGITEPAEIGKRIKADQNLWKSIRDEMALIEVVRRIKYLKTQTETYAYSQLKLPGFDGIQPVLRFRAEGGGTKKRLVTAKATLEQLRSYRDWFKQNLESHSERDQSRLNELNKLVSLVAKHAKRDPDITVEKALALEQKPVAR